MAALVDISIRGLRQFERDIGALPHESARAERRAMRRTIMWARKELLREASRESSITQKTLKKARRSFYRADRDEASTWLGTLDVRAGYLGTPRQQKRGAKVGKHKFPGAFVANIYGRSSIYKRVGKARFPVVEQTVPVIVDAGFIDTLRDRADEKLATQYISDLEFFSGVRG